MSEPTDKPERALAGSAVPDVAALAKLANDFFRALPGGAASAASPPSPAALPQHPPAGPNAVVDEALSTPSRGEAPFGIPAAIPADLYYFIAESAANQPRGGTAATSAPVDRVTALPFELPGQSQLMALAAPIGRPVTAAAASAPPPAPRAPAFYFLETAGSRDVSKASPMSLDAHPAFDVHAVRRDFPILAERVNGRPLVWFDNAATTQKPRAVIDRLAYFYAHENSNIHRAAHELAARATDAFEAARNKAARFLGAGSSEEIVFVRGATEAINLVANSWGRANLRSGDEILLSHLEHHANIVPWQLIAKERGAVLRVIPVDDSGQLILEDYTRLLNERTRMVAVSQVSNALGTITPVKQIIEEAHRVGACVLIDGAQAVSHMRVNVTALDADFYAFSGHKLFGPTGIGVLYGKKELLNAMPPWQGGGNMIEDVTFERSTYQAAPWRFEAGTGNIADAVGLGAAIDYVERIGLEVIGRYEHQLLCYAVEGLKSVPGVRLIGTAADQASVQSFVLEGHRTEEVGAALNKEGVAVRAGHHCAQPILRRFGLESSVRPSFAFYNTFAEIDTLIGVLRRLAAESSRVRRR